MVFLMGLNESFSQIRTQLLLMEPEPSITRAFSLVAQEVEQRNSSVTPTISSINATALLVKNFSSSRSSIANNKRRDRPVCTHCGLQGHVIDRCYKLHGYPPGYRSQSTTTVQPPADSIPKSEASGLSSFSTAQCQDMLVMLQSHLTKEKEDSSKTSGTSHVASICTTLFVSNVSSNTWILDSGATAHIFFSKESFISLKPIDGASVTLPNETRIKVDYCGDVQLSQDILLQDVLYIPSFRFNLISVGVLSSKLPIIVKFVDGSCFLQDKYSLRMIGKVEHKNGLYLFHADLVCNSFVSNKSCKSVNVWHARLGHSSLKHLNALKDILVLSDDSSSPCLRCPLAKQRHLSFQSNAHISDKMFDLIHCNTWGPFQSLTHAGYRYFLTIVDDHSRYTWIFQMRHKYDALTIVPQFFNLVNTQYGAEIKVFRSDQAPEFSFIEFFLARGVVHQFSCVGRPE